jgi:6-phosphogluconolactonase
MIHCAPSATSRLALLLFLVFLVGCEGSGNVNSTPNPPTSTAPQVGPPSGSEILYQTSGLDNGLTLFSVDPVSGIVGPATYAINIPTFNVGMFNLSLQPKPMAPPSAKFLYVAGVNAAGAGIFAFSIAGTKGQLNPLLDFSPYPSSAPLYFPTGAVMSGQGQYIYLSNMNYGNNVPTTSTIQAYSVDSSSGALKDGPILTEASPTTLAVNGFDTAGKYIYAWAQSPASLSLSAFAIDPATGTLTEVPGSSYFLIPNTVSQPSNDLSTVPIDFVVSASGKFVYAAVVNINAPGDATYQTQNIFAFSVDAVTGALTPVTGSPFSLGSIMPHSMALHPNGKFLYLSAIDQIFTYSVDSATGALSSAPISNVADQYCGNSTIMNPSGSVLITAGGSGFVGSNSYSVDANTGLLTPAPGSSTLATVGASLIVKTP